MSAPATRWVSDTMLDKLASLLFRCRHRHLSRPMSSRRPPVEPGAASSKDQAGYIVCLDCGKRFTYDHNTLSMGKPIDQERPH